MLYPTPFATVYHTHIVKPLMERITKRTIKITIEDVSIRCGVRTHVSTVPKWPERIYSESTVEKSIDVMESGVRLS